MSETIAKFFFGGGIIFDPHYIFRGYHQSQVIRGYCELLPVQVPVVNLKSCVFVIMKQVSHLDPCS